MFAFVDFKKPGGVDASKEVLAFQFLDAGCAVVPRSSESFDGGGFTGALLATEDQDLVVFMAWVETTEDGPGEVMRQQLMGSGVGGVDAKGSSDGWKGQGRQVSALPEAVEVSSDGVVGIGFCDELTAIHGGLFAGFDAVLNGEQDVEQMKVNDGSAVEFAATKEVVELQVEAFAQELIEPGLIPDLERLLVWALAGGPCRGVLLRLNGLEAIGGGGL